MAEAKPSPLGPWEVCSGALGPAGPIFTDCRELKGVIDPQGREIWLRAQVRPRTAAEADPMALYISGATSSAFWMDGRLVGSNGVPAATAQAERPGRYDIAFPRFDTLWTKQGGQLVAQLSAFHTGMRFDAPVGASGSSAIPSARNR